VVGAGATTFTCAAFAQGTSPMPHIVLLGDSVFDNAAYVAGGPDVVQQLRAILPPGWRATLNARDGASIADLADQLQKLPAESSHLVVSIGGNDALGEAALLDAGVASMAEALELMTRAIALPICLHPHARSAASPNISHKEMHRGAESAKALLQQRLSGDSRAPR